MKTTKKVLAFLLVAMMILAMLPTALADDTYTITINNSTTGHTYEAYQIFTGNLSTGDSTTTKLTDIKWGSGISTDGQTALQNTYDTATTQSAQGVADALTNSNVAQFAEDASRYLTGTKATSTYDSTNKNYQISGLTAGYYLVKDQADSLTDKDDAYTAYILKVVQNTTATPKSAKPTVDKQVWDEIADAEAGATGGWGESADHAINESFQFKLIANLPVNTNFGSYETYKVVFTDTMSDGVTFESIESVTVDGQTLTDNQYTCTATAGKAGGSWTLTITDIKGIDDVDLTDGADVVVIYNAHLNTNTETVSPTNPAKSSTNANTNKVGLAYSNNPNVDTEMGKTAEDTVYVFTYNVPNFKYYMNSNNQETPLTTAGFKLYSDAGCENEIKLNGGNGVYYPDGSVSTSVEMSPGDDGNFTIKGLDIGTYYLKETTTPDGYNTCPVMTINVAASANHVEAEGGASASVTYKLTVNGVETERNEILNQVGATLPETGGIGTTVFYVLGSILVIGAVVLLVSKKRMNAIE